VNQKAKRAVELFAFISLKKDSQKDGIMIEKKAKRWLPFNCFLTVFFKKKYISLSFCRHQQFNGFQKKNSP
jgi:hypothetical protein